MRSRWVTGGFPLGFMKIRLKFHEQLTRPPKQASRVQTGVLSHWDVLFYEEVILDVVE
jgi:hypothetical protein